MTKKTLTCKVCLRTLNRDEYDVGHEICSLSCKFWRGVPDENESCWLWQLKKNRLGYGVIRWKDHEYMAHRIGFAEFYGLDEHPAEMLFNICGNHHCVRGDHWSFDGKYKHRKGLK